ncbi:uncharacterized protein LOC113562957 [Ooceraea biroi]|uniref:uncharacterized protein LOC113562957 n=1 Tax=Ooceraea biroi TaxID=2015173 RepID=UPI0005B9887E|nr:uncharacterized protein LOC113562957 [Ooceraea biroi]
MDTKETGKDGAPALSNLLGVAAAAAAAVAFCRAAAPPSQCRGAHPANRAVPFPAVRRAELTSRVLRPPCAQFCIPHFFFIHRLVGDFAPARSQHSFRDRGSPVTAISQRATRYTVLVHRAGQRTGRRTAGKRRRADGLRREQCTPHGKSAAPTASGIDSVRRHVTYRCGLVTDPIRANVADNEKPRQDTPRGDQRKIDEKAKK